MIQSLQNPSNIILFLILLISLYFDIKTRKIPNILLLISIILILALNTYTSSLNGLVNSLVGFFVGIVLLIIPFALGGIGAGDVKLLGVIGALKGSEFVLNTFVYAAIWGGAISFIILAYHRQLLNLFKWILNVLVQVFWFLVLRGNYSFNIKPVATSNTSIPYVVPIFLGTITMMIAGVII